MRIPLTPVSVPVLAPKEILGFKAYSELVELPYMRLPGWYQIKNNDIIVFNWPADEGFPVDKKDNYVKRCVGIPGDTLEIRNGSIFVNSKKLSKVGKQQKRYMILMNEDISHEFLLAYELGDFTIPYRVAPEILRTSEAQGKRLTPYHIYTWEENVSRIKTDPAVSAIFEDVIDEGYDRHLFPDTNNTTYLKHQWDLNNYGPIYLPKRGQKIKLTKENWDWFKAAINFYEENDIVEQNGMFYTHGGSGAQVTEYTFKYGYYWMMGDNRFNSSDSRYWGYVPENHILGKPLFTFFSLKKVIGINEIGEPMIHGNTMMYETKGIRWNKIFKKIE
jgi:signal peptidase I